MLFVYDDNILALSHQAEDAMKEIMGYFKAKEGSIKPPEIYLGANVLTYQLPDGCKVWMTSPKTYVKNSIIVVEPLLKEDRQGYILKSNARNPFPTGYKPEINVTEKLDHHLTSCFMQLIRIL
jgi:hypothetical protein